MRGFSHFQAGIVTVELGVIAVCLLVRHVLSWPRRRP